MLHGGLSGGTRLLTFEQHIFTGLLFQSVFGRPWTFAI
jgi:hypothetical protein